MSGERDRRLTRRDVRRILRGEHTAAGPALRGVLTAASAPAEIGADTGELSGERLAMAAFTAYVAAGPSTLQASEGVRARVTKWAGSVTARVAATVAAVVLVAGGGLAAVATTTGLPGHGGPPHPVPASAVPSPEDTTGPSGSDATTPPDGAGNGGDEPQPTSPAGEGGPDAIPSPSPVGLCHSYTAGADHGKALDNPTFSALINDAGGRDKVDAYCAAVLAGQDSGDGHGNHATSQSHHPPERR